jgi:hypothetical protein
MCWQDAKEQAKKLAKQQAKPKYQKDDGTAMTAEEIEAKKAKLNEAADEKVPMSLLPSFIAIAVLLCFPFVCCITFV